MNLSAAVVRMFHHHAAESGLLPLTSDEIHLWLAFYEDIEDEHLLAAYRTLLTPAEKKQEPRFYFARDRRRYLVTRALVRTVLSRYAAVAPSEWMFSSNAYGRPEVANPRLRDLVFNVSHTHSLIILGVTRGRALGVDVENIGDRGVSLDVAHHYFAPSEVTTLAAAPRHEQQYRFFEYWTFKESYIKARGMGLSLPLDKFSFHYADESAVDIAIDPVLDDEASRWQFWQFRPTPDYLAAVCAESVGAESPSLVVRQVVPMLGEREFPFKFLRTSEPPVAEPLPLRVADEPDEPIASVG